MTISAVRVCRISDQFVLRAPASASPPHRGPGEQEAEADAGHRRLQSMQPVACEGPAAPNQVDEGPGRRAGACCMKACSGFHQPAVLAAGTAGWSRASAAPTAQGLVAYVVRDQRPAGPSRLARTASAGDGLGSARPALPGCRVDARHRLVHDQQPGRRAGDRHRAGAGSPRRTDLASATPTSGRRCRPAGRRGPGSI